MLNECAIEILNNKSRIIDNIIEKSHENGIKIIGNEKSTKVSTTVWRNSIKNCGHNGILIIGESCEPDIRGNTILQNRRAGIKLSENSIAHIGGTTKEDMKIPSKFSISSMKASTT